MAATVLRQSASVLAWLSRLLALLLLGAAPALAAETPAPPSQAIGVPADTPSPAAPSSAAPSPTAPSPTAPSPTAPSETPAPAESQPAPAAAAPRSPVASPITLPSAPSIDPNRFGLRPPDQAYGAFQRGLYKTALNLALPRAESGDAAAQTLAAEILSRGLGVPRDEKQAAHWYSLAAEQGIPEAQFQYALMLLDGRFVPKDVQGAYALLQAAAEAGNQLAQFNFAQLVIDREPGENGLIKAVSYYERAAKAGLADAQYAMSQVLANGSAGKRKDEVEARRWLTLAARQSYDTAELDLGTWLIEGRGGKRDLKSGFGWLHRAAMAGNVAAQNRVAKLYMQGIGTDPDPVSAAAWYFLARRAGLRDPEMDDFLNGLTDAEQKQALERANRLR